MYPALVVSILLYGPESWSTTLAVRCRLDVFDNYELQNAPPACVLAATH